MFSNIVSTFIKFYCRKDLPFLDYGGGYGMFVRLMRDKGFNFYRQDLYCENLFAKHFDLSDLKNETTLKFELLTTFEVFEHLENPMSEIQKMFTYTDAILFSTELQPNKPFSNENDWWYFVPEIGQHISFYSIKTLEQIALEFDCSIYSNSSNLHLLTKKSYQINPIKIVSKIHSLFDKTFGLNFSNPKTLITNDFKQIKQHIKNL